MPGPLSQTRQKQRTEAPSRRQPGNTFVKWIVGHRPLKAGEFAKISDSEAPTYAQSVSDGIAAENKHVENRVQWNLALQGFLYASYALALSADRIPLKVKQGFVNVIAGVGLFSCAITLFGLYAAYRSINHYKRLWLSNEAVLKRVSSRPFSDPLPSLIGRLPSTAMALVLFGSWFFLWDLARQIPISRDVDQRIEIIWPDAAPERAREGAQPEMRPAK